MKKSLLGLTAALFVSMAFAAVTNTPWSDTIWQLKLGAVNMGTPYTGPTAEADCKAEANRRAEARTASGNYFCHGITGSRLTYTAGPAACTQQPSVTTATVACAAGLAPPWQQTTTVTVGPPSACVVTTTRNPQTAPPTACQPIVVPAGPTLHFASTGNNANPGTPAAPKLNLTGINLNTLPPTTLRFNGGNTFAIPGTVRLMNQNVNAASPLVFESYGTGLATLRWAGPASGPAIEWGEWNDTRLWSGYVFRNLVIDGSNGATRWGFWLRGSTNSIVMENLTITGFQIGVYGQSGNNVRGLTLRNSRLLANHDMGMLGSFSDSLIENNDISGNNFSGSGFSHGTYLSGSTNLTIRGNRYQRNSVVNGVCQGGNMTFHGQMDGVLIEGNTIEQDAAAAGCWLMSITQGYTTAEWFRNFVVRNNRFINGGNTAMAVQSAPGIVIEGNVVINTQGGQVGIGIGSNEYQGGDVPDGDAIVRNNTGCYPTGTGNQLVRVVAPNSTVTNNVTLTGAAATTGVCAR